MKQAVPDVLATVGVAAIVYGVGLIYLPAAFIVAGMAVIAGACILASR